MESIQPTGHWLDGGVPVVTGPLSVAAGRRWWIVTASCPQRQLGGSGRRCGRSGGTDWPALGFGFSWKIRDAFR